MKKIKYIIVILVLGSCSSLKHLDAFDGFKGKPRKVESTNYRIKHFDGLTKREMGFKEVYFYDLKGRKIKMTSFKSDGSPSSGGSSYLYDKYGNEIQNTLYKIDGTINIQINYKYNQFGQQVEKEFIRNGKKSITKSSFDRKNRVQKIIGHKNDGTLNEIAIQKFDQKWREIELISYDNFNKQKSRIEFFYNKDGNQIQSKWYNAENIIYEYYNSTFNINNDKIRIEKYRINDGKPKLISDSRIEYKYDKKGNCIEERIISNGKTTWLTINKYKY